jgi:DNA primase
MKGVTMSKRVLGDDSYFDNEGDIIDRIAGEQSRQPLDIQAVIDHYHKRLYASKEAATYLRQQGIDAPALVSRFQLGYSDGSITDKTGSVQQAQLQSAGLLTDHGVESLSGCLVIPAFNDSKPLALYGLDMQTGKFRTPVSFKDRQHGIFNYKVVKVYDEVILTRDVLTCLQLVNLGLENVIALPDLENTVGKAIEVLRSNRVEIVSIAFDTDNVSRKAAELLTEVLTGDGVCVKTVIPPAQYTRWHEWLLTGVECDTIKVLIEQAQAVAPESVDICFSVKKTGGKTIFTCGEVAYQIMGLKETAISTQRVDVRALYADHSFPDRVDLYSSRSRRGYAETLSRAFGLEPARVEKDLLRIVDWLEAEREKRLSASGDTEPAELSAEEVRLGKAFLQSPDLFDQIIADMDTLGYVGEDLNKQLLYLCATSRKLDDPISVMIISQSAAGKSYLVDTVKRLIPEQETVSSTSISEQALNYMGENALVHKFFIFGEAVHSETVEHQIREMLSNQELARLVTTKDEKSGEMVSKLVRTPVKVAAVMTTTSHRINPENLSRFFVVNTDESTEQTRRIQRQQNRKYTIARYTEKRDTIPHIIKKHQAAQRLLQKIMVVNPFWEHLRFPDTLMRARRDNERFVDLLAVVAFLRQYQKEQKQHTDISYIECDQVDYEIAYRIMTGSVLGSTLLELPKGAVILYEHIREMVRHMAQGKDLRSEDVSFIQREVREYSKLGAEFIKKHIRKLVEYEYLQVLSGRTRGTRVSYRLRADEAVEQINLSIIPTPSAMSQVMKQNSKK